MAQQVQTFAVTAPGFYGLNTQDSSLDLAAGFALVANNCVIDQYGRVGSRKGWTKVNSSLNTDLGSNDIKAIGELITTDGTSYTLLAGNNKIFKLSGTSLVTLTYGGGGTAPTITDSNWQFASLNGVMVMFQSGHDPMYFDPSASTTVYKRISESGTYSGTVKKGNCVLSAWGRLWNANSTTDKVTIQFSDLKAYASYTGGSSGTLDVTTVWPKGGDSIVALAAHNNFLFIFGNNNILVYQGADDPTTMSLYDTIVGIGCVGRDTVAYTGTDLIFLSKTGVRSVLRTIQEKSAPLRDLSKNVRNDIITGMASETLANMKAVYSSLDAIYLLTFPVLKTVYCFDMKAALQDGSARVTTWDSIQPKSFFCKLDGTLYLGQSGYLGTYSGYTDSTATYRMQYYTNYADLGAPTVSSILKRINVSVVGGSNQYLTVKWAYDFNGSYQSQNVLIPIQGIAEYGIAEYGSNATTVAYYSAGIAIHILTAYPNGEGKAVQTGYEAEINGYALSIQKIEIYAKQGKAL